MGICRSQTQLSARRSSGWTYTGAGLPSRTLNPGGSEADFRVLVLMGHLYGIQK